MPSVIHQSLVLWLARKMTVDGYGVCACDGRLPRGGVWNVAPIPFDIHGVRPDLWGIHLNSGQIALGEAKSASDIANSHTRKQLHTFSNLRERQGARGCVLYIAVPASAEKALTLTLQPIGAGLDGRIVRMHVPDCLLTDDDEGALYEAA